MRDLVSMAAAATERCRVWPKTAAQDVKCVQAHCHGAGSGHHPAIFPVVFGELIHANVAQSSAICRTVNLLLLRTIVLTLARGEFRPRHTRQLPKAVDLKGRLLNCQSY